MARKLNNSEILALTRESYDQISTNIQNYNIEIVNQIPSVIDSELEKWVEDIHKDIKDINDKILKLRESKEECISELIQKYKNIGGQSYLGPYPKMFDFITADIEVRKNLAKSKSLKIVDIPNIQKIADLVVLNSNKDLNTVLNEIIEKFNPRNEKNN